MRRRSDGRRLAFSARLTRLGTAALAYATIASPPIGKPARPFGLTTLALSAIAGAAFPGPAVRPRKLPGVDGDGIAFGVGRQPLLGGRHYQRQIRSDELAPFLVGHGGHLIEPNNRSDRFLADADRPHPSAEPKIDEGVRPAGPNRVIFHRALPRKATSDFNAMLTQGSLGFQLELIWVRPRRRNARQFLSPARSCWARPGSDWRSDAWPAQMERGTA